jgi:hypothetical protein
VTPWFDYDFESAASTFSMIQQVHTAAKNTFLRQTNNIANNNTPTTKHPLNSNVVFVVFLASLVHPSQTSQLCDLYAWTSLTSVMGSPWTSSLKLSLLFTMLTLLLTLLLLLLLRHLWLQHFAIKNCHACSAQGAIESRRLMQKKEISRYVSLLLLLLLLLLRLLLLLFLSFC